MRLITLILAVLITSPVWAAPRDAAGRWAVRSNGRVLMIVTLKHDKNGWRGVWRRPAHFTSDGDFRAISTAAPPIVGWPIVRAIVSGDALTITFDGAASGEKPDSVTFRIVDDGTARMIWPASPSSMLVLDRASPAEQPIMLDPKSLYPVDQHWPTNAEMTALFEADQADRTGPVIDWSGLGSRDRTRAIRTKVLLGSGALASADDYYHAAFVFQHGSESNDYLLAHALAMIAVARGRQDASWIAAATLDRYLQRIGQKQIFGTQFRTGTNLPATQDPYDRELLSDAIRKAVGVPPMAAQEQRRRKIEADREKK